MHSCHDSNGGFPSGRTGLPLTSTGAFPTDAAAKILYSWEPQIFPYLEQGNLYAQYSFTGRFDKAPNDAPNATATGYPNQVTIPLFNCPSAPAVTGRLGADQRAITDYMAPNQLYRNANGKNPNVNYMNLFGETFPPNDPTYVGILGHNMNRRITEITDGTSNTLLLGECAGNNAKWFMGQMIAANGGNGAWANPATEFSIGGCDPTSPTSPSPGPVAVNCTNQGEIYAFHTGGANVLMGDGSVRFLKSSIGLGTLIAMVTRSYGEVLPADAN
jgi:prepilin-type processing-associated H-X9-DG protein